MKWVKRVKLMQFSKIAIVICVILSTVLAGFTVYGEKVGSFVIDTQEDSSLIKIALSEYEDLSNQTDRLAVKGLTNQRDTTLGDIPFDITKGAGTKTDAEFRRYIAHSFYVINNSEIDVELMFNLDITAIDKDVDSAVRVMLIFGEEQSGTVYAKWQEERETDEEGNPTGPWADKLVNGERVPETDPAAGAKFDGKTKMFVSESRVLSETLGGLGAGKAVKVTVVVWLEGWDAQCVDDLYGGAIRMAMNIKGY